MDEENVREPDSIFRDQLVPDYPNNDVYDVDLEMALNESIKDYENQIEKENQKKHRIELFKKLEIQLNYLMLGNNDNIEFFMYCFNIEKDKFIDDIGNKINLFKSHFDYLLKFLDEIYTRPLNKKKFPKIDKELYDLLIMNIKCI